MEFRRQDTEGNERRINGTFYPVRNEANELIGIGALLADVTHDHEREEALQLSNERFTLAAKATSDAVWDWDVASGSLVWNEAITDISGQRIEDIEPVISWWEERLHPDDHDAVVNSLQSAVEGSASQWKESYRFRRADGSFAHVEDRAYIIRDEEGRARRAIGAISDRTMQSAIEDSLRQTQKMDAVGRLSAGVAHDFNNVLAVVSVSSEFLLSEMGPGNEYFEEVLEIKKAAERGGRLTRQLLAFTRQQVLSLQVVDLNAVIGEMQGMLQRLATAGVALHIERAEWIPSAKLDRGQVEQIVINLVVNACDAMPSGGELRIRTGHFRGIIPASAAQTEGEFATLTVSDTGSGISEDVMTRMFDPFFTTKEVGRGTGLGLATVHGIVKQSGGEISVRSEIGEGSEFTIYFPAIASNAIVPTNRLVASATISPETVGETVLLVEDDEALRKSLEKVLLRAGYSVLLAENGAKALEVEAAHAGQVDLILTDARMPVMGGLELIRQIGEKSSGQRVLLMSGFTEDIQTGEHENSVIPFIAKPFTPDALLHAMQAVMGQPKSG